MKSRLQFLIGALTVLLFAGCASVGHEMDMSQTQQIKKGVTTRADVEKMFGSPTSVTGRADGSVIATWFYSKASNTARNFIPVVNLVSTKFDTKNQMLYVTFDQAGHVTDYTFSEGGSPINAGLVN